MHDESLLKYIHVYKRAFVFNWVLVRFSNTCSYSNIYSWNNVKFYENYEKDFFENQNISRHHVKFALKKI